VGKRTPRHDPYTQLACHINVQGAQSMNPTHTLFIRGFRGLLSRRVLSY
jgi:hypothetical protein